MKFALVGVGGAGGRIVNALAKVEKESDRAFSRDQFLIFDSDQDAFTDFTDVDPNNHVLVGDTHPDIRGEGLDGDIDLGAAVAQEDTDEIYREFDKLATHEVHATVFVAGLAGGTGGGMGPVILDGLQSISENPIYVLGILPDDSEGDQAAYNASRALQSYVELADNTILFDNNAWYDSEADGTLEETYQKLNIELVTRIIAVLAAGELEDAPIAENRMDASDMMRTLEPGGVSTLGYATTELDRPEGFFEKIKAMFASNNDEEPVTDATQIQELIQSTVRRKMTLPSELTSTEKGMLVLSGPRDVCSRKGFETGRYWLEQETDTVEVRAGDEPRDGNLIAASVMLTNVTEVPRIDELQRRAVAYKQSQEGAASTEDENENDTAPTAEEFIAEAESPSEESNSSAETESGPSSEGRASDEATKPDEAPEEESPVESQSGGDVVESQTGESAQSEKTTTSATTENGQRGSDSSTEENSSSPATTSTHDLSEIESETESLTDEQDEEKVGTEETIPDSEE